MDYSKLSKPPRKFDEVLSKVFHSNCKFVGYEIPNIVYMDNGSPHYYNIGSLSLLLMHWMNTNNYIVSISYDAGRVRVCLYDKVSRDPMPAFDIKENTFFNAICQASVKVMDSLIEDE
jgi:hypothetical protein